MSTFFCGVSGSFISRFSLTSIAWWKVKLWSHVGFEEWDRNPPGLVSDFSLMASVLSFFRHACIFYSLVARHWSGSSLRVLWGFDLTRSGISKKKNERATDNMLLMCTVLMSYGVMFKFLAFWRDDVRILGDWKIVILWGFFVFVLIFNFLFNFLFFGCGNIFFSLEVLVAVVESRVFLRLRGWLGSCLLELIYVWVWTFVSLINNSEHLFH